MIRLATDQNFNENIVRGVLLRDPTIDVQSVRAGGLAEADDPDVLAWAASERRVLLTHDVNTMAAHAIDRINRGEPMPGVFLVPLSLPIAAAIEDVLLLATCSMEGEWEAQVRYLPL